MGYYRIEYNHELLDYARYNRNNPTLTEKLLWKFIKGKQLGVDFNRQKPLLHYIVDFYCIILKLAIEVDGPSHDKYSLKYDLDRQKDLEQEGITFLRFQDWEILNDLEKVLEIISKKVVELKAKNVGRYSKNTP